MGTDNLFHKKRARKASELAQRNSKRAPYAKVLIVCEGEKTEPNYCDELRDYYELSSANVEICGENDPDPHSVLKHARYRYKIQKQAGDSFDRVYCVFDKDAHSNYLQVIDSIRYARPKGVYFAITSVPCFEYWLLLHYNYTTKPYNQLPNKSVCDQVTEELRNYMPNYKKGDRGLFLKLIKHLEFAKQNAKRALREIKTISSDNPSTRVHELVECLQNIKTG